MPNTATATRPAAPKADRGELLKEFRRRIVSDTAGTQILDYLRWLSKMSVNGYKLDGVFRRYSAGNMELIWIQSLLAGFTAKSVKAAKAWEEVGRTVNDDAVPLYIFVPFTPGRRNNEAAAEDQPDGPAVRGGVAFIARPVFDISHTTAVDPDAEQVQWDLPIATGDTETLAQLASSSPVLVKFVPDTGSANGFLNVEGITINNSKNVGNQIKTLAHELGHHYLDHLGSDLPRSVKEQEAELTAWIVSSQLGLAEDDNLVENAVSYLANWTSDDGEQIAGHKARLKMLDARWARAEEAANEIVAAYLAVDEN